MHLHLQHLGVLQECQVGHAHRVHGLFAVQTFDRVGEFAHDSVIDEIERGDEEVLFSAEQAEKVRLGDAGAVREGMEMLESDYLLCLDSDGQCDPRDFKSFWEARSSGEIIYGWRVKRADPLVRKLCSGLFHVLYQLVFRVPVHDPSCPYVLMRKPVAKNLCGELGAMEQGSRRAGGVERWGDGGDYGY